MNRDTETAILAASCHFPRPGWKLPHRETAA